MNYLSKVQQAVSYIEANLDNDIELADVASYVSVSQWHFQRIFKALTSETLKTYIRSRRLANALEKLLTTEQRIIEIAVEAGYESQESFTRGFQSAFGLTPNEYRKIGDKHLFLKKLSIDSDYLNHINNGVSTEPEIYEQSAMLLVGLSTTIYGDDSEKNNIAEKLPPLWENFLIRLEEIVLPVPGNCYGIIQPSNENPELLSYTAAIEVTDAVSVPDGMVRLEVPAACYAKFSHRGEVKQLNNTVNYIYSNWLLKSGFRHSYRADIEFYGEQYDPVSSDSLIHYAIPVTEESRVLTR